MQYYNSSDYLCHFGIPGQKWGVRRYQNEDGSLTEAGKARYYDSLTDKQKKAYDKLPSKDQERIEKKMSEGKSFSKSINEVYKRNVTINNLKTAGVLGAAYGAYLLWMFPGLRRSLKRTMLTGVSKIVNTKAVGGTLLRAKKVIDRWKMQKAGAVVLNKKNYKIFSGMLGG